MALSPDGAMATNGDVAVAEPWSIDGPAIGRCLCGGVDYAVRPARIWQLLVCNCSMCRRQTGAHNVAFGAVTRTDVLFRPTNGAVPAGAVADYSATLAEAQGGAVVVEGAAATPGAVAHLRKFSVSSMADRLFCSGCGALVAMDYHDRHTLWITLGLFDPATSDGMIADYERRLEVHEALVANGSEIPLPTYPSSHLFSEFRCTRLDSHVRALPPAEGFGLLVLDPCEPTPGGVRKPDWRSDTKTVDFVAADAAAEAAATSGAPDGGLNGGMDPAAKRSRTS